jgi:hypothetical protein
VTNEQIVNVVRLIIEADIYGAGLVPREVEAELTAALDSVPHEDTPRLVLAQSLLRGHGYQATSADPEIIEQAKDMARFLGADFDEEDVPGALRREPWPTRAKLCSVRFYPRSAAS